MWPSQGSSTLTCPSSNVNSTRPVAAALHQSQVMPSGYWAPRSSEELEPYGVLAFALVRPDELERQPSERLDALGPAPRAELLRVLTLPDFDRANRIGEFWGNPKTRTFAELLIDCEEGGPLGQCSSGCLREGERMAREPVVWSERSVFVRRVFRDRGDHIPQLGDSAVLEPEDVNGRKLRPSRI